jgi:antitoxin YefM
MSDTYTYTEARKKLAEIINRAGNNLETITIKLRNSKDTVIVSKDEYDSLVETAYIFKSPANAARILKAIENARKKLNKPMTMEELKKAVGFEQ